MLASEEGEFRGEDRLPAGGCLPDDLRSSVRPLPNISRYVGTGNDNRQLISGTCPICKEQRSEWTELLEHFQVCARTRHHPFLMRTCYCPYCVKKCSDVYALSAHIFHNHSKRVNDIRDDYRKVKGCDEVKGLIVANMREPYPFQCTTCKLCWASARGIAEHFVTKEDSPSGSCKGTVGFTMKPPIMRSGAGDDSFIIDRYDFRDPISCPYCTQGFTEGYTLSNHIQACHRSTQMNLETKLLDVVVKQPKKKLFYQPFMCSICHTTYRDMEGFMEHIRMRMMRAAPCNGEVRIVKFKKDIGGFVSNPAPPKRENNKENPIQLDEDDSEEQPAQPAENYTRTIVFDGTHSREVKAEVLGITVEEFDKQVNHDIVKTEPYDPDEIKITAVQKCDDPLPPQRIRTEMAYVYNDRLREQIDREKAGMERERFLNSLTDAEEDARAALKQEALDEQYEAATTSAYPNGPSPKDERMPSSTAVVKEEPMDEQDEATSSGVPAPQTAQATVTTRKRAASPPAAAAPPATAPQPQAVVKEEPMDEGEYPPSGQASGQTPGPASGSASKTMPIAKSPPPVEPATKQQPAAIVKEEAKDAAEDEDDDEWGCDLCDKIFLDEQLFIVHMKDAHGFELAKSEEHARQLLEGAAPAAPAPPPAKRVKVEEEELGASDLAVATTTDNAGSSGAKNGEKPHNNLSDWIQCPQCLMMCSSIVEFRAHQTEKHPNETAQAAKRPFVCNYCRKARYTNPRAKEEHERECMMYKVCESRDRVFNEGAGCPYCKKRHPNAYVLGAHIMVDHADIIRNLRHHYLMAQEFLPFRCNFCKVGFEEARMLQNHFRLREELGVPCPGNLVLHSYDDSVKKMERFELEKPIVPFPDLPFMTEDEEMNRFSNPFMGDWFLDEDIPDMYPSQTWKVKCLNCTEFWPRAQMRLHVKHEHPKMYYDQAPFKCKTCRTYGFYCSKRYADHWESCRESKIGEADARLLVCAVRQDAPSKPASTAVGMRLIPDHAGNDLLRCRFCSAESSPEGLLCHMKNEHPIEHFVTAPYQCLRCNEVGFYTHETYKLHSRACNGETPIIHQSNIYAITLKQVEASTGIKRMNVPSFLGLIEKERRKFGAFASFNRSINCPLCEQWCSSLWTLAEHYRDGHKTRDGMPFLCGGCGTIFKDVTKLKQHLRNQEILGNSQCYDMGTINGLSTTTFRGLPVVLPMDPNRYVRPPPLVTTRPNNVSTFGNSPIIANWRAEVGLPPRDIRSSHVNLARNEARQKRIPRLLPIKPLNLMSKSPLSGERNLYRQQQFMASAAARTKVQSELYYKQVSAFEKQRSMIHVDKSAPLSMPAVYQHSGPSSAASGYPTAASYASLSSGYPGPSYRISGGADRPDPPRAPRPTPILNMRKITPGSHPSVFRPVPPAPDMPQLTPQQAAPVMPSLTAQRPTTQPPVVPATMPRPPPRPIRFQPVRQMPINNSNLLMRTNVSTAASPAPKSVPKSEPKQEPI